MERTEPAPLAACTIISKNYLSLARVWSESFLRHHPGARTFVLIVDRIEGKFDRSKEAFEVIEVEELEIPSFEDLAFKYSILELNTAVKPFLMEFLFKNRGVEQLVYLDPDTFVYSPLTKVSEELAQARILLVPHILMPLKDDGKRPSETDFLISGTYNLGFIALRRHPTTFEFLSWWKERLSNSCYSAPERGLFTDQKWVDLVPSIFPGVSILKDRGYNVAYWNLHERRDLTDENGRYGYSETPLTFFHFSGLEFDRPERISKYQSRHRLAQLGPAYQRIFREYIAEVREAGLERTVSWSYAFGSFDDGIPITPLFRSLYADEGENRKRWSNPFDTKAGGFRDWVREPVNPGSSIPRFLFDIYLRRKDLQEAFPNALDGEAARLLDWAVGRLGIEHGIDEFFLNDLRVSLSQIPEARTPADSSAFRVPLVSPAPADHRPQRMDLETRAAYSGNPRSGLMRLIQILVGRGRFRKYRYRLWQFRLWREEGQTLEDDGSAATFPKKLGEALLGSVNYRALRRVLWQSREMLPSDPREASGRVTEGKPPEALPFGVNVFGYFDTESGIGEVARSFAAMLDHAAIPHALINVPQKWLRRGDRRITEFSRTNPYSHNLLMANADQAPAVIEELGRSRFEGRFNIGYWFWEVSRFPDRYRDSFSSFDEIWVASDFCLDAVAASSPIPVVKIAPGFRFERPGGRTRESFGISEGEFVFLYVFDSASNLHRKNPAGLLRAFRLAFPSPGRERLILKTTNAAPEKLRALRRLAGHARVEFLTEYLDREELLDLLAAADCYVSLHRSEGFGLTLLESMSFGKPVIATDYSGNRDFLNSANGFPVGCDEIRLRRDYGPYEKGSVWAEPDLAQAVWFLRRVAAEPASTVQTGARARSAVKDLWSVEAAAEKMKARLNHLRSRAKPSSVPG